jgi:HlyD family secretion protein
MKTVAIRVTWGVLALGLLAGLLVGGRALFFPSAPPPRFETATVDRGRIEAKVTATGTVSALVTVQVGSQVSGRVQSLFADFNSEVNKGDLLAVIDPELFHAQVAQARANVAAASGHVAKAKAQAENARLQLARAVQLSKEGLVGQADLDTARANAASASAEVAAARGSLEQAGAQLKTAEVNLAYTRIVSPVDGVVISRNVDVGQTVAAALQAPTLFTIAEDLRKMQVHTNVAEGDVGKLRGEMTVTFVVDAYPSERFVGAVAQIRNSPTTQQNVVTYDAVIDVDNSDLLLKPGMTANVTFVFAEKDDVVRVPNAALRFKPSPEVLGSASASAPRMRGGPGRRAEGGSSREGRHKPNDPRSVWVLRAGKLEEIRVTTGISDGTLTEVVDGKLSPSDVVVLDVLLAPGDKKGQGSPRGQRMPRMM